MATHSLKLSAEPVTQEMFDRMPGLLTAYQAKLVTGFSDRELADAVKEKQIQAFKRGTRKGCKRAYSKYTKSSVAKIVGFRI